MPQRIGDLELYGVEELSKLLGIQEGTLRKFFREGKLRGRKLARKWYTTEAELKAYFSQAGPAASQGAPDGGE